MRSVDSFQVCKLIMHLCYLILLCHTYLWLNFITVGLISETELGAQSIIYQVSTIAYMVGLQMFFLKCKRNYTCSRFTISTAPAVCWPVGQHNNTTITWKKNWNWRLVENKKCNISVDPCSSKTSHIRRPAGLLLFQRHIGYCISLANSILLSSDWLVKETHEFVRATKPYRLNYPQSNL